MPDPTPLSDDTFRALDEIAAQSARYEEVLCGMCVRVETVRTKLGRFGPEGTREVIEEPIGGGEEPDELGDFRPLLTGPDYDRTELPAPDGATRLVRALQRGASSGDEEFIGADFVLSLSPPRLLRAALHPPRIRGLARWLVNPPETVLRFEQVNGVPVPVEARMRLQSRGIGTFRFDQEIVTTMSYAPCN